MKQGARQTLPVEERRLLRSLSGAPLRARARALHEAGWSLASIANAFDPPRQRSSVRAWVLSNSSSPVEQPAHLPPPPIPSSSSSSSSSYSSIAAGEKSAFSSSLSAAAGSASAAASVRRRVYDPSQPRISPAARRRISGLAPLARRYRARTNPNGTYARANQELTELCHDLYRTGASVRELSLAAGVTYRAMARRLGR